MRDFRELKVWHKAHALTLAIYRETRSFPNDELYGLTRQIRRAAISIGANIAEGAGKNSPAEFGRFLQIALGSASELEYHWLLSKDLGYINTATTQDIGGQIVEVKKMLTGFCNYLKQPSAVSLQPSGRAAVPEDCGLKPEARDMGPEG